MKHTPNNSSFFILLADDDEDDRLLFKEAIRDLKIKTSLETVNDGQQLMDYLVSHTDHLPHVLFLDLNMPRKGGIECIEEIRADEKLKHLSIAIYSTSGSEHDIQETLLKGANVYIKKPYDFEKLKKVISQVININWQYHTTSLNRENFFMVI